MTRAWILSAAALAFVTGCKDKEPATTDRAAAETTTTTTSPTGQKLTHIKVDEKGFNPSSIEVKKGEPAALVFTRTTDKTCATDVVFPEIDVKKELPLNKPVQIDVPTDASRTLTFQCGMAMYKSAVVIR